jgi:S-DNA-T family DNA segregation ATPase FtsK/SpoIIIE
VAVRNLSEELALALGAPEWVAREGESLAVEMPRNDPEPVRLLTLMRGLDSIPRLTACIGLTDDGRPLLLRLPSPDVAHVLVAGTTGSGKTELMRSLIASLAMTHRQSKVQIVLIDPKRRGFLPLGGLPHLIDDIASDVGSALGLLEKLVMEMERRDATGISSPHIVIAVDELLDLLAVGGKPVELALTRIAQRGREAGLHLIAGAQKPSASALGGMLKANFPVRLVGRVGSAGRGWPPVSRHRRENLGAGRFCRYCQRSTIRFQAA